MSTPNRLPIRAVVLNFNGGADTLRSLRHLRSLDWPTDELQLVCVDNGSTDGTVQAIRAEMPDVDVRLVGRNEGFPANNHALRDLDGVRYVALVNNDAFVDPGFLAPLVEALDDDPALGAVCPKILLAPKFVEISVESPAFHPGPSDDRTLGVMLRRTDVDAEEVSSDTHAASGGWGPEADRHGRFEWLGPTAVVRVPVRPGGSSTATLHLWAPAPTQVKVDGGHGPISAVVGPRVIEVTVALGDQTCDVVNNIGSVVHPDGAGADRGWLEEDRGQYDEPQEVFAWCGGAVLLRPEMLADIGLFDERFFLYYEDTDLSWRGRARGWRYRTVPTSRVRHRHAASSVEGSEVFAFHVERNRLLMLVKDAPARTVLAQVVRYVLITGSYARRDLVRPVLVHSRPRPTIVRRRILSFLGFLRLLRPMLAERRQLRARQVVSDGELAAWWRDR